MKKAAFLGLGIMGGPMALNLARTGIHLSVFDVNPEALKPFADLPNCRLASSPADAARDADYLFMILPNSKIVEEALFGAQGAAQTLPKNALVVEMSTGDPLKFDGIAKRLAEKGLRLMDSPVGRTPMHAIAGDLLLMVGGDSATLEEARPMLTAFGKDIVHTGPAGSAIKLKIVNNYMSMAAMVLTAETLAFAKKVGLDRDTTVKVLQNTAAGRGQININFPRKVLAGDVSPEFSIALGLKDVRLAVEFAKAEGMPLFLGDITQKIFTDAHDQGRANQDCTAVLLHLEEVAKCSG